MKKLTKRDTQAIADTLNVRVKDVSVDEDGDVWVTQAGHGYWIKRGSERYASLARMPGRPREMSGGRRVQVWLDDESLNRARQIGAGNVSAGIRAALSMRNGAVFSDRI